MPSDSGGQSDSSDGNCEICGNNLRRNKIKCINEKCNVIVHVRCFESATKLFLGQNVNKSNWCCRKCICDENSSKEMPNENDNCESVLLKKEVDVLIREKMLLNKLLENLEYTNKLQKERLESIETKTVSTSYIDKPSTITYSMALKNINKTEQQNSAVLLVKSSDQNIDVVNEIKNKVSLKDLNIFVNKTKPIKGGMLINCQDINSLNKLKSAVHNKFGDKFSVTESKKLNPRLLIKNVDKKLENNEQIISYILNNECLKDVEDNYIKVVTKISRKYTQNVVVEVTPSVRTAIISIGYLYIAWEKYWVEDYLRVVRCYRCQRFGHVKKDCKSAHAYCPKCAGKHEEKDCDSSSISCVNCCNFKNKHNPHNDISIDHLSNDIKSCFVFKREIELLKSKTNYG